MFQKYIDLFSPFNDLKGQNYTLKINKFIFFNFLNLILVFLSFELFSFALNLKIIGVKYNTNVIADASIIPLSVLLFGVFVSSPFEELLFRWGLKFTPVSFTFLIFGYLATFQEVIWSSDQLFNLPKSSILVIFTMIFFSFFLVLLLLQKNKMLLNKKFIEYQKFIFYSSIILFGYSHFTKFDLINNINAVLFSPIIFLPYFIMGYFFGLIRMKFGILWSIIAHSLTNLVIPFIEV